MMHYRQVSTAVLLASLVLPPAAHAQELLDPPIRLEIGGAPGGGMFLIGGDDDTEVNFNVYTFSAYVNYYLTQKIALEGEYMFGNGWGQDIIFRNGLVIGQQLPFSNNFMGGVLFFPKGATGRLPYYVGGGVGRMSLQSRPTTSKIGYDQDVVSSESFMASRIGAGVKIPRGASAPNWAFRLDYHLMFVNANESAPAFFARDKTRTGHQVQFGILYSFRR
jgi:hypothetical protein